MILKHKLFPLVLIGAGMSGLGLFLIGGRLNLPIIPTNDFVKGIWFGVCLGSEILGAALLLKAKVKSAG